jgi:hypothetical protein
MTPVFAFAAVAATWQNFYLLVGTAAATLIGLMFVAITFGAGLVTAQSAPSARAFLDPPFAHFVTVLFTACLLVCPATSARVLGVALLLVAALRTSALIGVARRMREAHAKYGDIELSDWLMGVVLPGGCYAGLVATGGGFLVGRAEAFSALAVATVAILLIGVFGAWELMLWLALTRTRDTDAADSTSRTG